MKQCADKKIAGFSLIEVIVGIAVLGLVTIPICASLVLSVRINGRSRELMNAQLEAVSVVETLMESGISGKMLSEENWEKEQFGENVDVTIEPAEDTNAAFYQVKVKVESGGDGGPTVELKTTIRKGGGGT